MSRLTPWFFRILAWLCVLVACGRAVFFPRRVTIEARALQMHVRGEADAACDALFAELGLDRRFNGGIYRVVSASLPGSLPPMWIGIKERSQPGLSWARSIWVERDGSCVLPPLENSPHAPGYSVDTPEHFYVAARDGSRIHAAHCVQYLPDRVTRELLVWIHRDNRWRNVLRLQAPFLVGGFRTVPDDELARELTLGRPATAVFVWQADRESLDVPPNVRSPIEILDTLPDQTGDDWK